MGWSISSWRKYSAMHQPNYTNTKDPKMKHQLNKILTKLRSLPPLVHPGEVDTLKKELCLAQQGKKFLLQGGDCAERFEDATQQSIEDRFKILLQMALVLTWQGKMSCIKMGRFAGQYGKPRSKDFQTLSDGTKILSYKGDIINQFSPFTKEARRHDPNRLLEAYFHSSCALNYIRSLIKAGFADLHHSKDWDLGKIKDVFKRTRYQRTANELLEAVDFMEICGMSFDEHSREVDFYSSHEGLVLDYEECLTRKVGNKHYNVGAHLLWIGNRTRQLDSAHVEYLKGIENPIGIKVGPKMDPRELVALIIKLNPHNEPGKIVLITRLGVGNVHSRLRLLIPAIKREKIHVLWSCDPCHGNTFTTADGVKTRDFLLILTELTHTFACHKEHGTHLGGVHFELTGEDVTECVGGPEELKTTDLALRYTSYCDPRLNYLQSMEMSFLMADQLRSISNTDSRRYSNVISSL